MGALLSWGFELGTPWTWLGCRVPVVHVREEKENAALLSFEGGIDCATKNVWSTFKFTLSDDWSLLATKFSRNVSNLLKIVFAMA